MSSKNVKLISVEKREYQGNEYRHIVTDDGEYNVKNGKQDCLKKKWALLDQAVGKPITLNLGEYEGKPYVQDIILPLPAGAPVNNPPPQQQITKPSDPQRRSIERQTALKVTAEFFRQEQDNINTVLDKAEQFYQWLSKE